MALVKKVPYLSLIWDEESRSLISQWHGGFEGRNLRAGLESALEEFKKFLPNAYWIGDTRDIGVISIEDQNWIDDVWFKRLLATGLKYMAVVQPTSAVAKLSVNAIVTKFPAQGLTVYNCDTQEKAKAWIIEQTKGKKK